MKQKIIIWIRNQVKKARAKGLVLGLSGGLDSAVNASLCCQALGKKKVLGLIIPCASLKQDLTDAHLVAKRLGITLSDEILSMADVVSTP